MDTCLAGSCVGTPINCTTNTTGVCQNSTGTCDLATGECNYSVVNGTLCDDGNLCTKNDSCIAGACVGANACCLPPRPKDKKYHCGICVKDCGNEAYKVLNFFGLPGSEKDVDGSIAGGRHCPGTEVCCTPKNQTIFTYKEQICIGWFPTVQMPAP
jgi:hypothetical protein